MNTKKYERLMTPGRERMLKREAKRLEKAAHLLRNTPKISPTVEGQLWMTEEQPLSRQIFRHLDRLNVRVTESAGRKQSRPHPLGNRKHRRKIEAINKDAIDLSALTDVVEPLDNGEGMV